MLYENKSMAIKAYTQFIFEKGNDHYKFRNYCFKKQINLINYNAFLKELFIKNISTKHINSIINNVYSEIELREIFYDEMVVSVYFREDNITVLTSQLVEGYNFNEELEQNWKINKLKYNIKASMLVADENTSHSEVVYDDLPF